MFRILISELIAKKNLQCYHQLPNARGELGRLTQRVSSTEESLSAETGSDSAAEVVQVVEPAAERKAEAHILQCFSASCGCDDADHFSVLTVENIKQNSQAVPRYSAEGQRRIHSWHSARSNS